ncbi:hypothetical protein [Pseudomonas moraviensis]|uniref:hypothetical protein n=1 Tax=Pseudomonas moraviensis TaxID=321662 RepID=UPI00105A7903|nr:hypothetical protein [Pseudomonas moraviensis]TDK52277.1 hypothetical protein E1508_23450 [Pseudomonas moraviensis]
MSKLTEKIKEEFKAVIAPTVFFFVALHIVVFIRLLMLKETDITIGSTASVLLTALILGKSVVIADILPFINLYPHKPLAWNVAWKTLIYTLIALLLHYLERLFDFWREGGGLVAANDALLEHIVWPHFWAIQILLLVLVLMYCTVRELVRIIGHDKVVRMFFGPLPDAT